MNRILTALILTFVAVAMVVPSEGPARSFSWGLHRDSYCLDKCYQAPGIFPPAHSPCAVPCRPAWMVGQQMVPKAFDTACPSKKLPCYGMSYGQNPYPLFQ